MNRETVLGNRSKHSTLTRFNPRELLLLGMAGVGLLLPVPRLAQALPDLVVESFDPVRRTALVRNKGSTDAVFTTETTLVSNSSETAPAGGRIAAGQSVTAKLSLLVEECPSTSDMFAPTQAGLTNAAGQPVLRADPGNRLAESNEGNNDLLLQLPNPGYVGTNSLDLEIGQPRAWLDGKYLRYEFTIRNRGTKDLHLCPFPAQSSGERYIGGMVYSTRIDGNQAAMNTTFIKAPWVLKPNESKDIWEHAELATTDQYGVQTRGLAAGCHEITVQLDAQGLVQEINENNNSGTIYLATGGASCSADKRPDWCTYLAPQPLRLSNVSLTPPARLGPNANCGGLIGQIANCSGSAVFNNSNKGERDGSMEVVFSAIAPRAGVAELKAVHTKGRVTGSWQLTGDHLFTAPGGKPDSSMLVTTDTRIRVGTQTLPPPVSTAPPVILIAQSTYGDGRAAPLSTPFDVPGTRSFVVAQGQNVEYVVHLDLHSYSSAKGLALLNLSSFGIPANTWNDAVKLCL